MGGSGRWVVAAMALALAALAGVARAAEAPLVDLDARDVATGAPWANRGALGPFAPLGAPRVGDRGGVRCVELNGVSDAFRGPTAPASLTGANPRTIEVWALNPTLDSDEETLVSWGRRGGPEGSLSAFGWGRNAAYGAMAHWAADLGWNGAPRAGRWHFLVYTYDGRTARVYDNGVEKQARELAVTTGDGTPILLGAQTAADGAVQFRNEFTGGQQAGSVCLAAVRIRAGAMTGAEIGRAFETDAGRFGATRRDVEGWASGPRESLRAGGLTLSLVRDTQTAASLMASDSAFDFLPGDRLMGRASDGYYHLGDCTLRARTPGGAWGSWSSATAHEATRRLAGSAGLLRADITGALGPGAPVHVVREWSSAGGRLALRFRLRNTSRRVVEIGAFGAAMVFNNLITGRNLDETHDRCSFADPCIGAQGGYLQVTRLNGRGPALLALPEGGVSFEAYRPLYDDPTPRDVTFEGFYEWMAHTKAYAEGEWRSAEPWNRPTSRLLRPGEEAVYGFRFVLAPSIRRIEATLAAEGRPVAVGVPGYVLPSDQTGRLFLHAPGPVRSIVCEPAGAALVTAEARRPGGGWRGFTVRGRRPGRCRLTITHGDGTRQTVHLFVTPPEREQVRRLGAFHAARQWFSDEADPFHRTFSFLPFDRDADAMVLQHDHSWFSGLSDEIGAGASVAMAMKNLEQPDAGEISLLERYATTTLWGRVQNPDYSVRASLFYYDPKLHPGYYTVRGGWDRARTETTWRSFNYPHVAAVYWALYRLARNTTGLVRERPWGWYLDQAWRTAMAIRTFAPGYAEVGLMVGSVFPEIILDLRREGLSSQADAMEAYMHERERRWVGLRYPFGSEMPWDSTGQEEIYTWCRYFGADDKAQVTLDAILGYMPTVSNWAYNGAGRRYFDAPVNGTRWRHIVRMTNHYGSAINAIPVMDAFRRAPGDLHLLRVGYAGMSQIMANIDREGFGSYGFDCDPAILRFDPYTADYGIAFYGYSRCAGAYAVRDAVFGWLGFGCDVREEPGGVLILPRDGFRRRVFIGPAGLWLTLDAGAFRQVRWREGAREAEVELEMAGPGTTAARLRVERTAGGGSPEQVRPSFPAERGACVVPLGPMGGRAVVRSAPAR